MYFPKSQKADKELKAVCYNTAYGIYGKTLPYTVLNRLEAELKIITQKGYSLIFMIMQKAVAFSESRGYHTNPRGYVGNSLAAYFSLYTTSFGAFDSAVTYSLKEDSSVDSSRSSPVSMEYIL